MKQPVLLTIDTVAVADVGARDRLRPVSEAGVESLIASINELGVMKDAIHVRKRKDGRLWLIAGGHRLEAAKRLGWTEIPAKVWTGVTDDWARLMEVDDNLAGAEMDPLDTAVFLAARKRLYEKLHPETTARSGAELVASRWHTADIMSVVSFANATAQKFGLTERHVRRLIAAGWSLGPDEVARLRRAAKPVTLADLQVLSKAEVTERYHVVNALAEGRARSAAEASRQWRAARDGTSETAVKDPVEAAFKALSEAWKRAPMAARKRFLLEQAREIRDAQNRGARLTDWQDAADTPEAAE